MADNDGLELGLDCVLALLGGRTQDLRGDELCRCFDWQFWEESGSWSFLVES